MCGVCGFTFPAPQAESRSRDLEAMLASMSHRGPDGQGTFVSCGVALGHRRLAIIDLRSGDQPMTGPSGCSIVFNGEIYNYRELRTELESGGRAFATTSDTEVLLAAYEEWDHAFLDRMIGMFAFAIHDPRRGKIVLGRDRLGKKPLYFATTPVGLAFASEIKALLALPQVRADLDINLRAVRDYLALGYILAPKTIYANITRLSPGCLAFYDLPGKRIEIRRYYHPEAACQAPKLAFNMQTVECFDALLADAVRLSMAHSLELRVPFLDHRLVELVARLPDKAKMSGLNQKVVLKRAMAERLPRSILARAKKGFNFPAYCISSQSLEPPAGPGIFRKGFRLSPQREDVTYKSFNLLILGIWYEIYERFRVTNRWEPLS
ncbi:MAG TPA: asparagine synthetase B [Solidesulfovibrio magneticus]|nr:asparagine synthetase B [Solidesulfovibrio magneticus]